MANRKSDSYHHGDLRTALLTAATEMIADEGLESVTLRALGKKVGVSVAAPYRHFEDKAALLAAVAEEGLGRLGNHLQGAIDSGGETDPLVRLQRMGHAYIHFAIENSTHYRIMFGDKIPDFNSYPDLVETGAAVFGILFSVVEACLEAGQIRQGDPLLIAYVIWSAVHGVSMLLIDRIVEPAEGVDSLTALLNQVLINGLVP